MITIRDARFVPNHRQQIIESGAGYARNARKQRTKRRKADRGYRSSGGARRGAIFTVYVQFLVSSAVAVREKKIRRRATVNYHAYLYRRVHWNFR